jgi:hypothetical protein
LHAEVFVFACVDEDGLHLEDEATKKPVQIQVSEILNYDFAAVSSLAERD